MRRQLTRLHEDERGFLDNLILSTIGVAAFFGCIVAGLYFAGLPGALGGVVVGGLILYKMC